MSRNASPTRFQANTNNTIAMPGYTTIYQDPGVRAHLSGKQIAKLVVENLGLENYGVYEENVAITEQADTARLSNAASEDVQVEAMTPLTPEVPPDEGA